MELELFAAQERRVCGKYAEPLVFPPDIFGTTLVVRDAKTALALTALETPVAEKRAEDDLDLYRIRYDAPEHALRILPHDMNVGT